MPSPAAREGDRLREMTCRCGTLLVRETAVDAWRCPTYNCFGKKLGALVVLGKGGAVPA